MNPHPIVLASLLSGRGRITKMAPKSWKNACNVNSQMFRGSLGKPLKLYNLKFSPQWTRLKSWFWLKICCSLFASFFRSHSPLNKYLTLNICFSLSDLYCFWVNVNSPSSISAEFALKERSKSRCNDHGKSPSSNILLSFNGVEILILILQFYTIKESCLEDSCLKG